MVLETVLIIIMVSFPKHAEADSPEAGGNVTISIVESRESSRSQEEGDRKLKQGLDYS